MEEACYVCLSRTMLLNYLKGHLRAQFFYPLTERFLKRDIRGKLAKIKQHYQLPFVMRQKVAQEQLVKIVSFAGKEVPFYRDLFKSIRFNPEKLLEDLAFLQDIPYLTKDILRNEGERLLSKPLKEVRHHACKTGGSTGLSAVIYYDQEAMDYSAAATLFARGSIGKKQSMSELHFASRFPEAFPLRDRLREHVKCFVMNRSNIFFDKLDEHSLEIIWQTLKKKRPYLVHAHPSTLYALACYVEKKEGKKRVFSVFESSGELLVSYMQEKIQKIFSCHVIDRYGLAEFGVIAYQTDLSFKEKNSLRVFDSEGWMEMMPSSHPNEPSEIVFTGFRNYLMPLIRYRTGDLGVLSKTSLGWELSHLVGRIHDIVSIGGVQYATHTVQDILDRVGGIQEFQIDLRHTLPKLLLVPEVSAKPDEIKARLQGFWADALEILFVGHDDLIRVGHRAKFRHVVQS